MFFPETYFEEIVLFMFFVVDFVLSKKLDRLKQEFPEIDDCSPTKVPELDLGKLGRSFASVVVRMLKRYVPRRGGDPDRCSLITHDLEALLHFIVTHSLLHSIAVIASIVGPMCPASVLLSPSLDMQGSTDLFYWVGFGVLLTAVVAGTALTIYLEKITTVRKSDWFSFMRFRLDAMLIVGAVTFFWLWKFLVGGCLITVGSLNMENIMIAPVPASTDFTKAIECSSRMVMLLMARRWYTTVCKSDTMPSPVIISPVLIICLLGFIATLVGEYDFNRQRIAPCSKLGGLSLPVMPLIASSPFLSIFHPAFVSVSSEFLFMFFVVDFVLSEKLDRLKQELPEIDDCSPTEVPELDLGKLGRSFASVVVRMLKRYVPRRGGDPDRCSLITHDLEALLHFIVTHSLLHSTAVIASIVGPMCPAFMLVHLGRCSCDDMNSFHRVGLWVSFAVVVVYSIFAIYLENITTVRKSDWFSFMRFRLDAMLIVGAVTFFWLWKFLVGGCLITVGLYLSYRQTLLEKRRSSREDNQRYNAYLVLCAPDETFCPWVDLVSMVLPIIDGDTGIERERDYSDATLAVEEVQNVDGARRFPLSIRFALLLPFPSGKTILIYFFSFHFLWLLRAIRLHTHTPLYISREKNETSLAGWPSSSTRGLHIDFLSSLLVTSATLHLNPTLLPIRLCCGGGVLIVASLHSHFHPPAPSTAGRYLGGPPTLRARVGCTIHAGPHISRVIRAHPQGPSLQSWGEEGTGAHLGTMQLGGGVAFHPELAGEQQSGAGETIFDGGADGIGAELDELPPTAAAFHRHTPPVALHPLGSSGTAGVETADAAAADSTPAPAATASGPSASDGSGSPAGTAEAAADGGGKSVEAYRFLLHHIDAEIEALKRRHASVTSSRQRLEGRQMDRIRDLYRFMEQPWLLLPSAVPPPLPATALDVYLKEQLQQRRHSNASEGAGLDVSRDKTLLLAFHRNFKALPPAARRPYEEAARHNAALRAEMKRRLATGCARFEAFCQEICECTAAMVREGSVPLLPTGTPAPTAVFATPSHAGRGTMSRCRVPAPSPAGAPPAAAATSAPVAAPHPPYRAARVMSRGLTRVQHRPAAIDDVAAVVPGTNPPPPPPPSSKGVPRSAMRQLSAKQKKLRAKRPAPVDHPRKTRPAPARAVKVHKPTRRHQAASRTAVQKRKAPRRNPAKASTRSSKTALSLSQVVRRVAGRIRQNGASSGRQARRNAPLGDRSPSLPLPQVEERSSAAEEQSSAAAQGRSKDPEALDAKRDIEMRECAVEDPSQFFCPWSLVTQVYQRSTRRYVLIDQRAFRESSTNITSRERDNSVASPKAKRC
eukprot:gene1692-1054_t